MEGLVKEKEREANVLRAEAGELREQMARTRNQVEQLEEERNYNRAKLSELSGMMQGQGRKQAEVQLYKKCMELADVTADKDALMEKLRASQATVRRLEQEVSLTRGMVQDMSHSWDGALSSDENIVRLKREHEQSLAKATELSIQLAESQMKIDEVRERLNSSEKANRAYAEQLAKGANNSSSSSSSSNNNNSQVGGRGNFQDRIVELIQGDSAGAGNNDDEMRRMKQRIAVLEDENAAYVASLSAFKFRTRSAPRGKLLDSR